MNKEILLLVLSALAGILGTGIGGMIGAFVKNKNKASVGDMLTFAAGVMLGVVAFEMVPEAVANCIVSGKKFFGALIVIACVMAGVGVTYLVNFAVDKASAKRQNMPLECRKNHDSGVKISNVETLEAKRNFGLKRAGIVTLLAIALHNVPEGMAIGASGASNAYAGVVVALVIALHNVPEGMAISAPLVSGGVKASRAVVLSVLAGLSTLAGALVGVFVGCMGDLASSVSVSLASGAMIYVSVFDLLPVGSALKNKFAAFAFFSGIVLAMILTLLI